MKENESRNGAFLRPRILPFTNSPKVGVFRRFAIYTKSLTQSAISIFSFISVPLSLVDKSWKYHPRYHDKLFGVLFFIFSLTLSVGIRFGMRELANDVGNISNAGNDINVTSNTDTLNQFTGDEIATQNSNAVENINNSIITSANSTFDSQSGMLYANDGRELAHLTNYCIISEEGKIIARFDPNSNLFYDGFNQPLNVTIDDISFRHIKNIHENTLGEADDIADDIDIINGEILDAKTHAHIGFVTTNTLVHQNSIAFSNIDKPQPENVDMHSDHLVVKDENGALAIRFNSQTGILYGKDGHEIAHLINNHIITADGKTFAKYDPTSNLFYDKYMQPLNVKIDGTTFQHVKDVQGNGIDIINGEIFDAKTHKRIGSIMTIK